MTAEGRVLGEDLDRDLFRPLPPLLLDEAASTARRARADIERALNRDGRTITLDTPCPGVGASSPVQLGPAASPL